MRQSWKTYFIFSQKEQKGIVVLGLVLFLSVLLHWLFPGKLKTELVDKEKSPVKYHLFAFDPNQLDSADAMALGFSAKQFSTLQHYRLKGGHFLKATDIYRLYGLPKVFADTLLPYIIIGTSTNKFYTNTYYSTYKRRVLNTSTWHLDINQATKEDWIKRTNLNEALIDRILKYKNYVGGFENSKQLKKVYGMSDSIYFLIKPHLLVDLAKPIQLNSNTMNFKQWASLGLFQEQEIWKILKWRRENGGKIGWKELVVLADLTKEQADLLRQQVIIND